jgi:hypothetical protein
MSERAFEHPAVAFVTSVGALALQMLIWPLLFVVFVSVHRDPPIAVKLATAIWFFLPAFSLLGIASSVMRLRKRKGVCLSVIGLVLNVGYLALFLLIVFAVFVLGLSA